jgi:hypothetical protein
MIDDCVCHALYFFRSEGKILQQFSGCLSPGGGVFFFRAFHVVKKSSQLNQYDRPFQLCLHSKIFLPLQEHNGTGIHTHFGGMLETVTKIIHVKWGNQFSTMNQQWTMKKDTP